MEPRKIWKGTRTAGKPFGRVGHPGFLPFALWLIVPNKCEYRNNLSGVHRFLIHIHEKIRDFWIDLLPFFYFLITAVPLLATAHSQESGLPLSHAPPPH